MTSSPKVYIVVLNWNGWKDTIECLEAVFENSHPNYSVIVCDNNSSDDSLGYIKQWADGGLSAPATSIFLLQDKYSIHSKKPIKWVEYNRKEAEEGGLDSDNEIPLILVQTGDNLGFSGGNNVGVRYALARDDFDYVWLLNNDTVIEADALSQMISHMQKEPQAGACGSKVLYYNNPDVIQAMGGGHFNKALGGGRYIGKGASVKSEFPYHWVKDRLDYVLGASMLVRKDFIEKVGLMSEDYFLYFEEIDWASRGKKYSFTLTYAEKSLVYHKDGGSTKTNNGLGYIADYHGLKNRIVFTRKFYPFFLPLIYIGLMGAFFNRLYRGQPDRGLMILRLMLGRRWL
jgi:GT2 family glycosyltransferase